MVVSNIRIRCPGAGCPSKALCLRYQRPQEVLQPGQVRAALYARRAEEAAACSEYVAREPEEGDHAAQ